MGGFRFLCRAWGGVVRIPHHQAVDPMCSVKTSLNSEVKWPECAVFSPRFLLELNTPRAPLLLEADVAFKPLLGFSREEEGGDRSTVFTRVL